MDLAAQTASVDGLLTVTTVGLRNATATGCKVRMKGNAANNVLDAFGYNIVSSGGGGRDKLGPGRQQLRPRPAHVRRATSRSSAARAATTACSGGSATTCCSAGPAATSRNGAGGVDTCRAEVRKNCER